MIYRYVMSYLFFAAGDEMLENFRETQQEGSREERWDQICEARWTQEKYEMSELGCSAP